MIFSGVIKTWTVARLSWHQAWFFPKSIRHLKITVIPCFSMTLTVMIQTQGLLVKSNRPFSKIPELV